MPGSPENPFSPAFTKRSGGKIKITALILRRGALSWVDHLWQQPQCLVIRSRGHREEGEGREDKHERTVQLIWGEITHCLSQSINTCSGHICTFIFYKGHCYLRTVLRIQREKNSKHRNLGNKDFLWWKSKKPVGADDSGLTPKIWQVLSSALVLCKCTHVCCTITT